MITPHRLNRSDVFESRDSRGTAYITGMQDQVNAAKSLEDSVR